METTDHISYLICPLQFAVKNNTENINWFFEIMYFPLILITRGTQSACRTGITTQKIKGGCDATLKQYIFLSETETFP